MDGIVFLPDEIEGRFACRRGVGEISMLRHVLGFGLGRECESAVLLQRGKSGLLARRVGLGDKGRFRYGFRLDDVSVGGPGNGEW